MKARGVYFGNGVMIALLMLTACLPVYCQAEPSPLLNGGEPGLKIIYKSTNQFVIYVDEPWTAGPGLVGGYETRNIKILLDRSYNLKQKIATRTWHDAPQQLYDFDDQTVFTSEGGHWDSDRKTWVYWPRDVQAFSIDRNSVSVSSDVYAMAQKQYGLKTNQLFLGKIGTNIFYWETQNPRKAFYCSIAEKVATNYFEFSKEQIDLFGVVKSTTKDVGFIVLRRSKGFFHYAPCEFAFVEMSFKNAKQVK